MIDDIGPLRGADESLTHQIVDTFAVVSESDYAWTEKIWTSIASVDGSVQVDFGLGKYHNRGIIDGFGGVSRGREQWTVRGSRELRSAPEDVSIGPISYEIVEPLRQTRVRLEPNDVQPISFDLVLSGRRRRRSSRTATSRATRGRGRIDVNVVRYHQGGWATGTITVDGETYELGAGEAFGFRDHSWGVRQGVGAPAGDLIGSGRAGRGGAAERQGDHEVVAVVLPAPRRLLLRDRHLPLGARGPRRRRTSTIPTARRCGCAPPSRAWSTTRTRASSAVVSCTS